MSVTIDRNPNRPGYLLKTEQVLPVDRDELFEFFGDAGNLQVLTPPWLHFQIITPMPIPMDVGTLIDYRIRLHGIPIRWRTEIACWEPSERFVDQQIRGPYRLWRHEHIFTTTDEGTLCEDRVEYQMFGGALVNALLVKRDLLKIFQYRQQQMIAIFDRSGASAKSPAAT